MKKTTTIHISGKIDEVVTEISKLYDHGYKLTSRQSNEERKTGSACLTKKEGYKL